MYRAPEMVNLYMRDILTERTDIWALGCIFYSLCFLRHPFQDQSSLAILAGKFQIPKSSPFPPEVDQLIFRMLDVRHFLFLFVNLIRNFFVNNSWIPKLALQ